MAPYVIGPDQALVFTGRWPRCRFANVSLWNRHMMTFDYANRRVSLNRRQTQLEKDGILETRRGVGTFVREVPTPQAARAHRERELRELIRRFVGDAALLGFTLPELIDQLRNQEKK